MDKWENVRIGLDGLQVHKLRSGLTMLGIIFGVAAVISMLAIGEGAKREALEKFKTLGVNNIIVRDKELTDEELEEARAKFSPGLTLADAEAIGAIVPSVQRVAAQAERKVEARHMDKSSKVMVVGVSPDFHDLLNYSPRAGTFFTALHHRQEQRACVLGAGTVRALFPVKDPLGKKVKLHDQWFEVIGIMGTKTLFTETVGELAARDLNQDIYVPLSTFLRRFDKENPQSSQVDQLTAQVRDSSELMKSAAIIRRILERRHRNNDDFDLVIPYQLLLQEEKERRIYNMVLGSIAAISLLVGGIGIMNIMLATVLERTSEIGLRRAMGARRKHIMSQFLAEAVGLSLLGGIAGVVIGVGMALTIDTMAEFETVITPLSVIAAFGLSGAVGILSGTFPARRAAEVSPIDALRYE